MLCFQVNGHSCNRVFVDMYCSTKCIIGYGLASNYKRYIYRTTNRLHTNVYRPAAERLGLIHQAQHQPA